MPSSHERGESLMPSLDVTIIVRCYSGVLSRT